MQETDDQKAHRQEPHGSYNAKENTAKGMSVNNQISAQVLNDSLYAP